MTAVTANPLFREDRSPARARPVYLDYQATTPADPRVVAAMLPYFTEHFGNPHSASHDFGREAEAAVETARSRIAGLIGADLREIIFTSGATESNNLAVKGVAAFLRGPGAGRDDARRDRIVTVATEHKCVLEACCRLGSEGWRITVLPVQPDGLVDPARLAAAIGPDTALVSVMTVNNEIGVVQPLAEIGALCRERGVLFHTDAAQAVGKIALNVETMGIDLLSISGHKMYGPKGIGALYVRRRPRVRLLPLIDGGGQERGLRSGTLPTPLCVGLGIAAELAAQEMNTEAARLLGLRTRLLDRLRKGVPDIVLNGNAEKRIAGNLNLAFPGITAEGLIAACPALAFSTGSACSSASVEPSYVLRALNLARDLAGGSIRLSLGRFTTGDEVDFAADMLVETVRRLRAGDRRGER
jgi:cysteine desulfurase